MNREDIIRMAREAGIDAEKDTLCRNEGWVEPLTRFAALVIANHPPQSYMTWQEGFESGKQTERAACAKVCEAEGLLWGNRYAAAIRARGNK